MHDPFRIEHPCQESWEAMTPNGAGRHCDHCQKTVVDLTECTEEEALEHVAASKCCARLRVDSAGRPVFVSATIAGALVLAGGCTRETPTPGSGAPAGARASAPTPVRMLVAGDISGPMSVTAVMECAADEVERREPEWVNATYEPMRAGVGWTVIVRRVARYDDGQPVFEPGATRLLSLSPYGVVTDYRVAD